MTNSAKEAVIDGGYDVVFGARPLKRYIESHVETLVAKVILGGDVHEGDTVKVDAFDGEIKVYVEKH